MSAELQAVQAQNRVLKQQLNKEVQTGSALREQLTRSRQLSYYYVGFAVGTAAAAAYLAAKLQRLH